MKLYFITGNKNKFEEAKLIFSGFNIEMINLSPPEIQSNNLEDIVRFSLNYLRFDEDSFYFLEDSGLFIDSLNGFPGPYTRYVYETIGIDGVLKLIEGKDRDATFVSVVGIWYQNNIKTFVGTIRGTIAEEPRGKNGFAYDVVFIPEGEKRTFAEMNREEKNRYSHRAKALRKVLKYVEVEL